jgi:hypothetical protein
MINMRLAVVLALFFFVAGCKGRKVPDVSKIKVDLQVQRFEQDFFAIDTNNVGPSLQRLHEKYPGFLQDYVFNILGLPPQPDSSLVVEQEVKAFIHAYALVKDSADKVFTNFDKVTDEVRQGLRYVKYYFPSYKLPSKLVTFIGPINSYGNILTTNELAVGLQLYMGGNYSLYQSEAGQQLYPTYISKRFKQEYIPVNSMKNIIDDMYPNNSNSRPMVEQMIEVGRRLYLLDQFLPNTNDTLKTGYTKAQLDGAYENEELIWSFFVKNELLFANDPAITKDYMNDGPNTAALGQASPGFVGQFVGWQIVKKWMGKNDNVSLAKLMGTNPKTIFEQAKYKPK